MPEESTVSRAELIELEFKNGEPSVKKEDGRLVRVQFNPDTVQVDYTNNGSGGDQQASAGVQYVGKGRTTLNVDLLFDVTRQSEGLFSPDDVRRRTKEVNWFMRAAEEAEGTKGKYVPPGVRFAWGSFQFDGVMVAMNERLQFFDPEGHPLRAEVSITISKQEIQFNQRAAGRAGGSVGATGGASIGAGARAGPEDRPAGAETTNGTSVQRVAAKRGKQGNWKEIAAESGVENPRAIHNPDALKT
jgi:hypothetical protein